MFASFRSRKDTLGIACPLAIRKNDGNLLLIILLLPFSGCGGLKLDRAANCDRDLVDSDWEVGYGDQKGPGCL